MKELSVSEVISQGWELAKKHGLVIAAILLVISIIQQIVSSLGIPVSAYVEFAESMSKSDTTGIQRAAEAMQGSPLSTILEVLVELILSLGVINAVLSITKGAMASFSFDAYKMPFATYFKFIVVEFLYGVATVVGCLFCLVPGIFLGIKLQFAPYYILDNPDASIDEAFKASWNMTKGNFWSLFGFGIVCIGIILIGLCCCCIGVYFAQAIVNFAEANAYFTLKDNYTPIRFVDAEQ